VVDTRRALLAVPPEDAPLVRYLVAAPLSALDLLVTIADEDAAGAEEFHVAIMADPVTAGDAVTFGTCCDPGV
jgi:hypothetical protein